MNPLLRPIPCWLIGVALGIPVPFPATAQEVSSRVVAQVDDVSITEADVEREVRLAFPQRLLEPAEQDALKEETLEQLIRRQLVLRYLRETEKAVTDAEIDVAIDRTKKQLAQREKSWDSFLQQKQVDEPTLRKLLLWQLSWQRLLDQYLTEANLQNYFSKHRRDFDGTRMRVAHILFPLDPQADEAKRSAMRQQALDVLARLKSGELGFPDAAVKFSSGPSRDAGGDLGWISRHEPMPEPFSRAAFALEAGQVSEPVESSFGFHLIRCEEIQPGQKRWQDVRPELEAAIAKYVFRWIAEQTRSRAKIQRFP